MQVSPIQCIRGRSRSRSACAGAGADVPGRMRLAADSVISIHLIWLRQVCRAGKYHSVGHAYFFG